MPGTLTVIAGDLAHLGFPVDAIVSSDDNYLSHGGGVSAALWAAAGLDIEPRADSAIERSFESRMRTVGDVVVTDAGQLEASYLLHAITIDFDRGVRLEPHQISALFGRCLDVALDLGLQSIALPLLGAGAAGLDGDSSAAALDEALARRETDPRGLDVWLVTWSDVPGESRPATTRGTAPTPFARAAARSASVAPDLAEAFDRVSADWAPERRTPSTISAIELIDAVQDHVESTSEETAGLLSLAYEERARLLRSADDDLPSGAAVARLFIAAAVRALLDNDAVDGPTPSGVTALSAPVSFDTGTGPVRALRNLLVAELPPETITEWDEQLAAAGYQGAPEQRLLEWCAHHPPDRVLIEMFRVTELRRLARSSGYEPSPHDVAGLVDEVLRSLGFPATERVETLSSLETLTASVRDSIPRLDADQLPAAVTQIAAGIEHLLWIQLRFLIGVAYRQSVETWVVEKGEARNLAGASRASMGRLIGLLRILDTDLHRDDSIRTRDLRRALTPGALTPDSLGRIVEGRNRAAHRGPGHDYRRTNQERQHVRDFCDLVDELVAWWRRPDSGFPSQGVVEAIHLDQWGRRTVSISTDRGPETVFTDHALQPGQAYLMLHLTNPWSVDPLIIERGGIPSTGEEETP